METERGYNGASTSQEVPSEPGVMQETSLLRTEKINGCLFINQYLMIKCFKRRSSGKTFLCLNLNDSELYVMKIFRKADLRMASSRSSGHHHVDYIQKQMTTMRKMMHTNVVKICEVIDDPVEDKLMVVMEYLEQGPLITRESLERRERLPESLALEYFRDMIQALDYLHSRRVAHGNLKPGNILVSAGGIVKLSDFGFLKGIVSGNGALEHSTYTLAFRAPETMQPNNRYRGQPADIYALGACLYTLVAGETPFNPFNLTQFPEAVQNEEVKFPEDVTVSDDLLPLLLRLLLKDPKERITLSAICEHPWVTNNGKNPVPRWPEQSILEQQSKSPSYLYELIRDLVVYCTHKKIYREGEHLFKQGEPGSFMLYIISGECEVLLTCNPPRPSDHLPGNSGSTSADPPALPVQSSIDVSTADPTEEDRNMMQTYVEASTRAHDLIRMQKREQDTMVIGHRRRGDVVGEISLLMAEGRRTATVRATKKMLTKFLSKDEVMRYLTNHPKATQYLKDLAWTRQNESLKHEGLFRLANIHEELLTSFKPYFEDLSPTVTS